METGENMVAAAEQLRRWLKEQDTILKEMADYAGVTISTVSRWLKGELKPTGEHLGRIALTLNGRPIGKDKGLKSVATTRDLVDWVGLYGYSAADLKKAMDEALKNTTPPECPLCEELRNWPLPPLATLEEQTDGLPETFVQRPAELERLRAMLLALQGFRVPAYRRIAVWGMPGIGKTVLAKAVALDDAVREHFRDGVLWAELGPEAGRVEEKAAFWLQRWGHRLGLDMPANATAWEWRMAIQQYLSNSSLRLLIILDDAWWVEDIEPLLVGGAQTQILITTRNQAIAAAVPDCTAVELGAMSNPEARRLLYVWSGPQCQQQDSSAVMADELIEWVEANPLALRLLGALVKHEGWDYVLRRVRSPYLRLETISTGASDTRYASVERAVRLSYEALPSDLKRYFRWLGVFPYGGVIAAVPLVNFWELYVPGMSTSECIDRSMNRLNQLYDRALLVLVHQREENRNFRLHTLLHDYAREELRKEQEWDRVRHRYVEAYTGMAEYLAEQYGAYPQGMDGEWPNIAGAFDYALALKLYDNAARLLVFATSYLLGNGKFEEFDRYYARLQPYLDRLSAGVHAFLDYSRVRRHITVQDWDAACPINEVLLSNPNLPVNMQVYARLNQAKICYETGDLQSARRFWAEADELGSHLDIVEVRSQLAVAKKEIFEAEGTKTLEEYSELIDRAAAEGNVAHRFWVLLERARLLIEKGWYAYADCDLQLALHLARQSGGALYELEVWDQMAQLYLMLGRPEDAEIICQKIFVLLDSMALGERITGLRRAFTKRLLSMAFLVQGKLDGALTQAREAIYLSEQFVADPESLGLAWRLLSAVHEARGELEDARRARLESEKYLRAAGIEA